MSKMQNFPEINSDNPRVELSFSDAESAVNVPGRRKGLGKTDFFSDADTVCFSQKMRRKKIMRAMLFFMK
tara:strand:- start:239 stop:448 length:210 start_codon:yes stop_codon:yes gene_type:complete